VTRIFPFLSGVLFTAGVVISGMAQPAKIVGFLNFFGAWDPSMIFVTTGAVAVYMPVYRWVKRLQAPLFAPGFSMPTRQEIDRSLVIGSVVFGIGWGLSGYCPGPGMVALGAGRTAVIVFMAAMLAGMAGFAMFERATRKSGQ